MKKLKLWWVRNSFYIIVVVPAIIFFFWLMFYALAPEGQGLRPEIDYLLKLIK